MAGTGGERLVRHLPSDWMLLRKILAAEGTYSIFTLRPKNVQQVPPDARTRDSAITRSDTRARSVPPNAPHEEWHRSHRATVAASTAGIYICVYLYVCVHVYVFSYIYIQRRL